MKWLGIDVGGANLKLADGEGLAHSEPFPLWLRYQELAEALIALIKRAPGADGIAATMTGELCDCYDTKADGVRHIVNSLQLAAGGRPLAIYGVDGQFHDADSLHEQPRVAAASNWHALARYASHWMPRGTGVLIDIGSTTSDIIPVNNNRVATSSQTDTDRLLVGELVYTGVGRTPIATVVRNVPYRGMPCPVAAELFATTGDIYCVLEDGNATSRGAPVSTADGRGMSPPSATDRLARMICADRTHFSLADAIEMARHVSSSQIRQLADALHKVASNHPASCGHYVISGSGEFLARRLLTENGDTTTYTSLSQELGPAVSSAAAARAVAMIAREECPQWP